MLSVVSTVVFINPDIGGWGEVKISKPTKKKSKHGHRYDRCNVGHTRKRCWAWGVHPLYCWCGKEQPKT